MSNRIIKDTMAITVITLVAGLTLGVVQDITTESYCKAGSTGETGCV